VEIWSAAFMSENLIWIDLEMTGLDPDHDSILEIATVVTDSELNELAVGPELCIHHDEAVLRAMDEWNRKHHAESGLWGRVLASAETHRTAEAKTLEFLRQWSSQGSSPICGNSICQDRRFLYRQMPELQAWFHYRNLDVSTLKELAARWAPEVLAAHKKQNRHEALSDIRESISELAHYRKYLDEFMARPHSE
jgi:oligoribonuclease